MSANKKVCKDSLIWIQAMRQNSRFHNYDLNLMCPKKYPEIFGDHTGDFGHSGGSFYWCVKQAKKIDNMGLENWIKTDNALGYGTYFKKAFDKMLGGRASVPHPDPTPQELQ